MKEWVISVVCSLIIVCVCSIITPKGKTSKIVESVLSVVFLLTVFSPLISGKVTFSLSLDGDLSDEITVQREYLDYVAEKTVENKKANCIKFLENYGINDASVQIEYTVSDFETVKIKKVVVTVNKENENKDFSEVIKSLTEITNCDDVTVKLNE